MRLAPLAILLFALPASARSIGEAIVAEGPCIRSPPLAAQVEKWLGVSAIDDALRIRITEEQGPPHTVSYTIERAGDVVAERKFSNLKSSCEQTLAVVALAIAVALDPLLVRDEVTPPVPRAVPPPPRPPPLLPPPAPPKTMVPVKSIHGYISAAATTVFGVLPSPAFGGAVNAHLLLSPNFAIGIGASYAQAVSTPLLAGALDAGLFETQLEGCLSTRSGLVLFGACTGADAGAISGHGSGVPKPLSTLLPWVGAHVSARQAVRIADGLRIELIERFLVPILPPAFDELDARGNVIASHAGAPVAASLSVGIAVDL